jgi:hypothetical protein
VRTNSGDTCRAAALQDQGIILQPSFIVGADLAGDAGRADAGYRSFELGIYAVYPSRKFVSPKVRLTDRLPGRSLCAAGLGRLNGIVTPGGTVLPSRSGLSAFSLRIRWIIAAALAAQLL